MKKIIAVGLCMYAAVLLAFAGGAKETQADDGSVTIGIAKIVQHAALDQVEQGVIDVITESGIAASYDLQNANGDVNTAAQIANKYKAEHVDAIVAIATPVAVAMASTITDIPIIFGTVNDPVGAGLLSTTEHGEGNITGMSDALPIHTHLSVFKEIAGIETLGYIYTSSEANSVTAIEQIEAACAELGMELITQSITNSSEVKQAAEALAGRVDGVYLTTDNTVFSALPALTSVFEQAKKPVFSADVTGAMEGGCMIASGFNYYKAGRATGEIVVAVLNGTAPEEIPVRFMTEPADSDLLIDLDAAANCGITIPESYLSQANMIYENGVLTQK